MKAFFLFAWFAAWVFLLLAGWLYMSVLLALAALFVLFVTITLVAAAYGEV